MLPEPSLKGAESRRLMPRDLRFLHPQRLRGLALSLLLGSLLVAGCRGGTPTADAPPESAATPTAEPGPESTPTPAPTPEISPGPVPSAAPPTPTPVPTTPTAVAPTNTQTGAALPDSLVKQWEPLSNVLIAFGAMTITANQVQWANGQSSPYVVVSMDGGYLLKLETAPKFYDTPYPYLKLIPKSDASGGFDSIDAAFYETEAQAQSNEYVMFGGYFIK